MLANGPNCTVQRNSTKGVEMIEHAIVQFYALHRTAESHSGKSKFSFYNSEPKSTGSLKVKSK